MYNQIFTELNFLKEHSSASNKKIAAYIIENLDKIYILGLYEIAELTNTSYATVIRFFKLLSTENYKNFKKAISILKNNSESPNLKDYSIEFSMDSSFETISKKIHDFSSAVISTSKIELSVLERAVEYLNKANFIYFVGLGTSAVAAHYGYVKFSRLSTISCYDTDTIITKMRSVLLKENNILFAISSSGRTKSIVDMAKNAKNNNATVISISDFSNSPLSAISDIAICTTLRESNRYIDVDSPLILEQLTILDVLYACVAKCKKTNTFDKTKNSVENYKIKDKNN